MQDDFSTHIYDHYGESSRILERVWINQELLVYGNLSHLSPRQLRDEVK